MNNDLILGARLNCVASFVKKGSNFADIGTDHAKLPIFLLQNGWISKGYASDIADGPIKSAMENKEKHQIQNLIIEKADGLDGVFHSFSIVEDIAICGMGGEMIVYILQNHIKDFDKGLHFVLQPMTKFDVLRQFLFENGFEIEKETIVNEQDKFYLVMSVYYTAIKKTSMAEMYTYGLLTKQLEDPMVLAYMKKKRNELLCIKAEKMRNNVDTSTEDSLLEYLEKCGVNL